MKFDVSKLTDEQLMVAEMIIKEARAQGVNPDIVLPMAYVESRFNPNVKDSESGAIGVMQLMPGTAKDMKVDPRDLQQNVYGGVKFIKTLMDNKKIGTDTSKLVAAYHMGPDAKFFKTGNPEDIGDKTLAYVEAVNNLSGGMLAPVEVSKEGAAVPIETTPVSGEEDAWMAAPIVTPDAEQKPPGFTPSAMVAGAIPGTVAGGSLGAYQTFKPAVTGALTALENVGRAGAATPAAPPTSGGMPPPQGPVSRTPVGGKGTFNYAKAFGLSDFDAARAADMSKAPGGHYDIARQVREAEAKIGPGYRMVPERADLLLPEQVGSGPRGARTAPIPTVEPPAPGLGQRVQGALGRSPLLSSTLGGASMGAQAAESAERLRRGDIPGAVGMGTGALGSAMTMLPRIAPGMGPPGLAMSVAGPLYTAMADYTRSPNRPTLENPAVNISATILKDLKETEAKYQSNLQKARGPTGGFSLPPMQ